LSISLLLSCETTDREMEVVFSQNVLSTGCSDLGDGWSIPRELIYGGGVGKDGIPAIENPKFVIAKDVNHLLDDELVIGLFINGEYKAYPHRIMEKHEIANDRVGSDFFSLTFCPLTGTALAWERSENNSFGVSGLLHNSNLIAYDRATDSNWAQIYSKGINGINICADIGVLGLIETNWATWRNWYPDSKILSDDTGFTRNYDKPPVRYRQPVDAEPFFPVTHEDDRLPKYERVLLVVIDGKAKVYQRSQFKNGITHLVDFIAGHKIDLIGSEPDNFAVAYISEERSFGMQNGKLVDVAGNEYDVFGQVVEGPNVGEKLEIAYSMMGYWFAVSAFYTEIEIFIDGEL